MDFFWNLPFDLPTSPFYRSLLLLSFHFCQSSSPHHRFIWCFVFLFFPNKRLSFSFLPSLHCRSSRLCDQSWGHVLSLDTLHCSARLHKAPSVQSLSLSHTHAHTDIAVITHTWITKCASDWLRLNMHACNASFSNALRSFTNMRTQPWFQQPWKKHISEDKYTHTHTDTNTHPAWMWRRVRISFSLCLSLGEPPGQHTALDVPELLNTGRPTLPYPYTHTLTSALPCTFSIKYTAFYSVEAVGYLFPWLKVPCLSGIMLAGHSRTPGCC